MSAELLLERLEAYGDRPALVCKDTPCAYARLSARARAWVEALPEAGAPPGTVVGLYADYSPESLALLLALLASRCTAVPITQGFDRQKADLYATAEVEVEARVDDRDAVRFERVGHSVAHPLLRSLKDAPSPGLVLFSSGATGRSKGIVHDGARLLAKYATPRRAAVTLPFMLFDHIGGINTVLHVLSSGGTAVIAPDRRPETICRLVQAHRVEVLPASPTFLNLLLLSDRSGYDLSSLRILAYGAERMPAATLARLRAAFPGVDLVQNYGLSEVGILQTRSESSGSLWVKLGGDEFETRVRDGLLEIKAKTAMLGYLNEASPFTEDGWLRTGDRVEQAGEYVRILGRDSDIVIVGGEKVYPAEVEDAIAELDGVLDVVVGAEDNAITGQIVKATVQLGTDEKRSAFRARMQAHLAARLPPFKIPQKVQVTKSPLHNARFKKVRA